MHQNNTNNDTLRRIETLKNSQKGFTTSEILIAAVIVGVVAAITIPVVTANYQKVVTSTKVRKSSSEFSNIADVYITESQKTRLDLTQLIKGDSSSLEDFVSKKFNVVKVCRNGDDGCFAPGGKYRSIEGDNSVNFRCSENAYLLADSSAICVTRTNNSKLPLHVQLDINGPAKPNVGGKDMFMYCLDNKGNPVGEDCRSSVTSYNFSEFGDVARLVYDRPKQNNVYTKFLDVLNEAFVPPAAASPTSTGTPTSTPTGFRVCVKDGVCLDDSEICRPGYQFNYVGDGAVIGNCEFVGCPPINIRPGYTYTSPSLYTSLPAHWTQVTGNADGTLFGHVYDITEDFHVVYVPYDFGSDSGKHYQYIDCAQERYSNNGGTGTTSEPTSTDCPNGYVYNNSLGKCVQMSYDCPDGYEYDSSSGECVPSSTCTPGYVYDSSLGYCIPSPTSTGEDCAYGYVYDSYLGYCVPSCSPGYVYDGSLGYCVPTPTDCQVGYYKDPTATSCEFVGCPTGYGVSYASGGNPICTPIPTCTDGMMFDPTYATCVPTGVCEVGFTRPNPTASCSWDSCPTGYYEDRTRHCAPLPSCNEYWDVDLNMNPPVCTDNCPSGWYPDYINKTCKKVDCAAHETYDSVKGECVPTDCSSEAKEDGYYWDAASKACVPIDCTKEGKILKDGKCVSCPEGQGPDDNFTCKPTEPTDCSQSDKDKGFQWVNGSCQCPSPSVVNQDGSCVPAPSQSQPGNNDDDDDDSDNDSKVDNDDDTNYKPCTEKPLGDGCFQLLIRKNWKVKYF